MTGRPSKTTKQLIALAEDEMAKRKVTGLTLEDLAVLWKSTVDAVYRRFNYRQIRPGAFKLVGRNRIGLWGREQLEGLLAKKGKGIDKANGTDNGSNHQ